MNPEITKKNPLGSGRKKGRNYPISKNIRITEEQNNKWDVNLVRATVDGKFKRLYEIMNEYMDFNGEATKEILEEIKDIEKVILDE